MQRREWFQALERQLELADHGVICAILVFDGDPKEARKISYLWRIVEENLLIEVRELMALHEC